LLWHDEVELFETPKESRIHDTNDNGFHENSLDWSLHLLSTYIIKCPKLS
jgi:hypothetical protein